MLQTLLAGRETASLQLTALLPEGVALHLAIRPSQDMRPCPSIVGGARVVCYTPIDARHVKTENTVHLVAGPQIGDPKGLAICQYDGEDAYYLFGCNEEWESQSDTWHETLDDAKSQAEFEYAGTSLTWVPAQ